MIELLAPAGNMEKLTTALHFGADAVYLSGKNYGLRAFSDNFNDQEIETAVKKVHSLNKKAYVTLNIFAFNSDFVALSDYIKFLESIKVDAVIVADVGIFSLVKNVSSSLDIHISTQSNVTNKYSARFWAEQGARRIVLAREVSLNQISEIRSFLPNDVQIEAFVHGAMCMSYSGRCLLSNYLADRPSNRGECAQSCRWEYSVTERSRKNEPLDIEEDERGTYIFNSKDMNMLPYIDKLIEVGVESFKIEGRVKSAYYTANAVNAYRRAIDLYYKNTNDFVLPTMLYDETLKASHRKYCTGFYFSDKDLQCLETSKPNADYQFCAVVVEKRNDGVIIEQRNRFKTGDELEVLSPTDTLNMKIVVDKMLDENENEVTDALKVQQKLFLKTDLNLLCGDILRKKCE